MKRADRHLQSLLEDDVFPDEMGPEGIIKRSVAPLFLARFGCHVQGERGFRRPQAEVKRGDVFAAGKPLLQLPVCLGKRFEGENAPESPQRYDLALLSIGRVPNGKKIGAERAGIAVNERGFRLAEQAPPGKPST